MPSKRFSDYLESKAELERKTGVFRCSPIRLTNGQYAELTAELGHEPETFTTCQGVHQVQRVNFHARATGDNVAMCPREDLFVETDRDSGVILVSAGNSVTSVPDNIGCVEVLAVGELVTNVKPGDIVFIDFYSVKQGYIVSEGEIYLAGSDAFFATFDPISQTAKPLDNYVLTKAAPKRFKVALTGNDLGMELPDTILTDGIVSGTTSGGSEAARSVYQEVVSVGRITSRPRPGVMTALERKFLEAIISPAADEFDELGAEEAAMIRKLSEERALGRAADIRKGDLVTYCTDLGTRIRIRGEYQWVVPYNNVLAVLEDDKILEDSIQRGRARLILKAG